MSSTETTPRPKSPMAKPGYLPQLSASRKFAAKPVQTKIVCTLGPATSDMKVLERMIDAGMDIVRLNFSHGEHEDHTRLFNDIRKLGEEHDNQLGIICDLQGPKIRTGKMVEPFMLNPGDVVRVTAEKIVGTKERFTITYASLAQDLQPGDLVYVNDGVVRMVVTGKDGTDVICRCEAPGVVSDRKGVNMPTANLSADLPTPKDKEDLKLIAKLNPEWVAASFVGSAQDVNQIRQFLIDQGNPDVKIISKVERPIALTNLDEIIAASDALMVARGDLGVEIPPWEVPFAQKDMIERCNKAGKPVILATQMLESMIQNSRPTRAEASDVYNGVLDGADAVMLSAETSVGAYPVEAVKYMDTIADTAAQHLPQREYAPLVDKNATRLSITSAIGHAAHSTSLEFLALEQNLKSHATRIVVFTTTGRIARMVSKFRPSHPIVALTHSLRTARELNLVWGVRSAFVGNLQHTHLEMRIARGLQYAVTEGLVDIDDEVIVVAPSMMKNLDKDCGILMGIYKVKSVLAAMDQHHAVKL
eukprot:TRINITY_DN5676_c0_g1_i1.p1 TRINITY_DN5676_c0_g1~~TRINITY_DN5676_c0_g1_i1.p1  ORF type:complete len:532 (-),score=231.81 TRINITY_DN5676_c0_g1_i1:229-1824(-)